MEEINGLMPGGNVEYTEDNIRHLDDMEHIRVRSGMYIGRLGDGTQNDDGIYVLLKEVMDNSIDEFKMGAGKRIEINIEENLRVSVRDYGRGIPQGKLIAAVTRTWWITLGVSLLLLLAVLTGMRRFCAKKAENGKK